MSAIVKEIQAPIERELELFETRFASAMKSRTPLLDKITAYIVRRKGKQMRPMFTLLCAKLFSEVTEPAYIGASLIELLHTATLVHDDVVDDSYERRGFFSINALWKNKIAVLVGDYLLSKGLLLAIRNGQFRLLELVSVAVEKMSEGELLQIEKARKLDITEEVYFEIITNKTASLIAACCAVGASAGGADEEKIEQMRLFGEYAGIAFQIKDDLLDLDTSDSGKPKFIDIQERKMTLPLIFCLKKADASTRNRLINTVKHEGKNKKEVEWLVAHLNSAGGIDYAKKTMMDYRDKALSILLSFPASDARNSLEKLVRYTTDRKK